MVKPSTRWWRFNIRSLLFLTFTVAVFLAGYRLGFHAGRDAIFDELIKLIESTISPDTWKVETRMSNQNLPPGWNGERVNQLLSPYDELSEDEQVAEDEEAAAERAGQAVITVPDALLPAIRQMLAGHRTP